MNLIGKFEEKTFSKSRNIIINALEEGLHKHYAHIWIELDVTDWLYWPWYAYSSSTSRNNSKDI